MKKISYKVSLIVALIASSSVASQAQTSFYKQSYNARNNGTYYRNDMLLSFAYGFPNTALNSKNSNANYNTGFGPVYAKFEYAVRDEIGIGVSLGAGTGRYKWHGYKGNGFSFASTFQGFYHFNKLIPVKNLDVYVGSGFSFVSTEYDRNNGTNNKSKETDFNIYAVSLVGARWYFNPKFSAFVEVGNDALTTANLGVTFKF